MDSSSNNIQLTREPIKVNNPQLFTTVPKQTGSRKQGQLTDQQLQQYFEKGYIVLENVFTPEEIDPCKEGINQLVEELAQKLYKAGKITKLYKEYGFYKRLTKLENEFPGAVILLHKAGKMPKAIQNIWANERMLNIIEQIIGPDIAGHPGWNLRPKAPNTVAAVVPWHQDSAYFDDETFNSLIPTAWIPFINADENNGCMQMVQNGHKAGYIAKHQCCAGPTWYVMVEEQELENTLKVNMAEDVETCPVPYGGLILFHNLTPHRSLVNISNDVRWSIDLRWQRPDRPYGLWGLKDGVVFRSSKEPNLQIDWDTFHKVDRNKQQQQFTEGKKEEDIDEFDTTIPGPWMLKWEIVHENTHTDKMRSDLQNAVVETPA